MPTFDPEAVYLEPTQTLLVDRATGNVSTLDGVTVHAKLGARWQRMLLMPDEGEPIGALYARLGQWIAEEPQAFASELFEGRDCARSGDSA